MNTKSKTIAVMLAAIMVSAVAVPMAMAMEVDCRDVTVDVVNNAPEVICKCECPDEAPNIPGTQINPNPDGPKTVHICAVVCDKNGVGDISSVTADVSYPNITTKASGVMLTKAACGGTCCDIGPKDCRMPVVGENPASCVVGPTCALYCGQFDMESCDPAGEYRVVVTATDSEGQEDKMQNRFFYESIIVLEIVPSTIDFGQVEICTVSYNETQIHNKGNDPAIVTVSTEGLSQEGGAGVIAPGDLDIAIGTEGHKWLTEPVTFDTILECCEWHTLNFSIHVKDGTPSGTYKGTINFTTKHAPERTVLLENKDDSDIYLYEPIDDTMEGDMAYSMDDCSYTFNGYGLQIETGYCLIYYADDWPGHGMNGAAGGLINNGQTDTNGNITLAGTLPCMPLPDDADYDRAGGKYGKVWLVPCSDYDMENGKMNAWTPANYLFEIETIDTWSCCTP